MPEHDDVHQALSAYLGDAMPSGATRNINDALNLAGALERRGFAFRLRDACPKDPGSQSWKATFSKGELRFETVEPEAAMAVCRAALAALRDLDADCG